MNDEKYNNLKEDQSISESIYMLIDVMKNSPQQRSNKMKNRKVDDTKQDKRDQDELKKIEKEMRKNKELQKKLSAKGMTLDDVLRQMKKDKKKRK